MNYTTQKKNSSGCLYSHLSFNFTQDILQARIQDFHRRGSYLGKSGPKPKGGAGGSYLGKSGPKPIKGVLFGEKCT